jgi:HPt (histidine-containing phosphotransfer) domain-containing protein
MLDNDKCALQMMLTKFVEITPKLLQEINESFTNRNYDRVKKIAHEMKPSIDILNIASLKEDIRLIEQTSADSDKTNELKALISKLNNIYTQVLNEIGEMIF